MGTTGLYLNFYFQVLILKLVVICWAFVKTHAVDFILVVEFSLDIRSNRTLIQNTIHIRKEKSMQTHRQVEFDY